MLAIYLFLMFFLSDFYMRQWSQSNSVIPPSSYSQSHDSTTVQSQSNRIHHCPLCGKTFKAKNHLNYHMVTHTGSKDFACSFCGRRFGLKHSLRRHILTKHSDQDLQSIIWNSTQGAKTGFSFFFFFSASIHRKLFNRNLNAWRLLIPDLNCDL